MGESKLPKPPMQRPGAEILHMKQAVSASRQIGARMDDDTREFMHALGALVDWLDHLEKAQPLLAAEPATETKQ